ncbi:hypothetical protein F383_38970 [Gossypium arboreum]|uniref:Uncharacterized protein n=1 Tax=Gossypium arboreum TaxID=29729 RepID=A0A0B0MNJ6_GOSAR|nr:hypothetical protein F383_38970 [Gossypium arboreum]
MRDSRECIHEMITLMT